MVDDRKEMERRLDAANREMRHCLRSEAAPRINAMLELARAEPGVPVLPADLDHDPWLLACPNGTLELRTGTLREHRRADLITRLCPTPYRTGAPCPLWLKFLRAVFKGDAALIDFLRRLLGYALTGDVREHVLPIFWGDGANGKSTLITAVLDTLGGDLAMKANAGLLMPARGERHATEIAQLFGKRLVVASETDQEGRLDEARIKELTGGEPLRARRMREDFWGFTPTHKLILLTNHKPKVTGTDTGIWRRLRLVPFEVTFWDGDDPGNADKDLPEELRQDKQLPEKLAAEHEGILAWMVQGCLDWQKGGLTLPERVKAATQEYRSDEDVVSRFLDERCLVTAACPVRARASALFAAFGDWLRASGEEPWTQRAFGDAMGRRFKKQVSNGTWYLGVTLPD
jgi:putative DNA primase/helicase